jgi:hypothetical protein
MDAGSVEAEQALHKNRDLPIDEIAQEMERGERLILFTT